jgi:hypothetical protein
MNRYLAKLGSLDEKRVYPSNPQNPQNPPNRGFEGFEGPLHSSFLPTTAPTELPGSENSHEPLGGAFAAIEEEARHDRFEERAAILEFDEGLPRSEAEAIARQETAVYDTGDGPYCSALRALGAQCPDDVPEDRWHQAIGDATAFISEWGEQAHALGWTEHELFGLHPVPERPAPNYSRLSRLDDMGLLWLLRGRPVVALTAMEAAYRCPDGAILKYYGRTEPTPQILNGAQICDGTAV